MEIAGAEPGIMLITEVIPKAQLRPIEPARLMIPGYQMYANFDPLDPNFGSSGRRGICIYIANAVNSCEVKFPGSQFSEQLWVKIKMLGGDSLLVGCIYRSPSSDDDSIVLFQHMLQLVMATHPSHLLIAGDFNLGDNDWQNHLSLAAPSHCSHKFLEVIEDYFLHQHVSFPTRFRQGNSPRVSDLIFTNEENMVQNLNASPGLGKSDHIILRFALVGYTPQVPSTTPRLSLNHGDYARLADLAQETSWTVPEGTSIDTQHQSFQSELENLCLQCIPHQKPNQ